MNRDVSQAVTLIKSFEGIEDGDPSTVNLDAYLCPAGYWTIGWGHVVLGPDGKQVKGHANKPLARAMYPNGITKEAAGVLLDNDVRRFAVGVDNAVTYSISDTRFCALVSFAFNVGMGNLLDSTLLRLLNLGEPAQVPAQLRRWNKSNGSVLAGLTRRREAEGALWNSVQS